MRLSLRTLALALPVIFALHALEETPGFVAWFNELVTPPITQRLFMSVNALALVVSVIVAAAVVGLRTRVAALVAAGWVGFLMLANGIFHIVATLALGRYCPGVATATLLYLPFSLLFFGAVVREHGVSTRVVTAVALLCGLPMYAHGYLIVFRGSRFF